MSDSNGAMTGSADCVMSGIQCGVVHCTMYRLCVAIYLCSLYFTNTMSCCTDCSLYNGYLVTCHILLHCKGNKHKVNKALLLSNH